MKNWTKLLVLTAFLAVLVGCKCSEPVVTTVEKERIVEVHTRDTTIITQADSASVKALLRCDSAYNVVMWELVTMQGDRIETNVTTQKTGKDMLLTMECHEDSLENIIQLQDSIIRELQKNTLVVKERYVPAYYKNTSTGFWILFAILLIIAAWKAAKLYFKIQSGGLSQFLK